MPVLNDFGEAGYQRVVAQLDAFAARLNVPREVIRQYWSDTAHLPTSIAELEAWGAKPDREYGQVRRDPVTGAWTPLATGPTPGKTPEQRGGFPHFVTNDVGNAQRYQQVDAQGNIFGGSWDPAQNAAHPEWANQPAGAPLAEDPNARQRIAASGSFGDPNNHTGQDGQGYWSVVGGQRAGPFATREQAEQDYNARGGPPPGGTPGVEAPVTPGLPAPVVPGGATPPAPAPSAPSGGYPGGSGSYPGDPGAGVPGTAGFNPNTASAVNAAFLAWMADRRFRELEMPEFQLKSEVEKAQMRREDALAAWKRINEEAQLTGTINGKPILAAQIATGDINGTPSLDARRLAGEQTGYTGEGIGARAARMFATEKAANPAMGGYGPQAAAIWKRLVPSLTDEQALEMSRRANEYNSTSGGQAMPDDLIARHLSELGGPAAAASAMGTPTLDREREQNQTAIQAMTLLANVRGEGDPFAYAQTLANVPESIRGNIQAAINRLPVAARNPAQADFLGGVGVGTGQVGGVGQVGAGDGRVQGGPALVAQPGMLPAATGPRTAATQTGGSAMAADPGLNARLQQGGAMVGGQPAMGAGAPDPARRDAAYMQWAARKAQAAARGEPVTEEYVAPPPGFLERNPSFDPRTHPLIPVDDPTFDPLPHPGIVGNPTFDPLPHPGIVGEPTFDPLPHPGIVGEPMQTSRPALAAAPTNPLMQRLSQMPMTPPLGRPGIGREWTDADYGRTAGPNDARAPATPMGANGATDVYRPGGVGPTGLEQRSEPSLGSMAGQRTVDNGGVRPVIPPQAPQSGPRQDAAMQAWLQARQAQAGQPTMSGSAPGQPFVQGTGQSFKQADLYTGPPLPPQQPTPTEPASAARQAAARQAWYQTQQAQAGPTQTGQVLPMHGPTIPLGPPVTPPPQGYHPGTAPAPGTIPPGALPPAGGPRTPVAPIRPAVAAGMGLASQLSPTAYARTPEYMRNMLWNAFQSVGENKANVQDEFRRSLPVAVGPRTGRRAA